MITVPTDWERGRLKWDAAMVAGGTPSTDTDEFWLDGDDPSGMPFITIADMSRRDRVTSSAKALSAEGLASRVMPIGEPGTLLLAMYASVGEVAFLDMEATWNQALLGITPNSDRIDARFLRYVLLNMRDDLLRDVRSNTQANLNASQVGSIWFDRPPLDEQCVIADYLDRETVRIDTLIEEQQRLIEMLHERRDSLIAHVLLRGLDQQGSTRPSGDPRLGEIPESWRVVPTRHLCRITTGSEDSGNATDDGEYPFFIRGRQILRIGHFSFDCEAVMTPGDGQGGTGKVFHYFDGKFEAHQRVYVFTDFTGISGRYFYYFLSTFLRPVALAGSNTVTMESLRRPLLAEFPVVLPSTEEQLRILDFLDEQIAKIDMLIAETERFIELARERRAALITAAVTGQIDVRTVEPGEAA